MNLNKQIKISFLLVMISLISLFLFMYMYGGVRLAGGSIETKNLSHLKDPQSCPKMSPWGGHMFTNSAIQSRMLFLCFDSYASAFDSRKKMPMWTSQSLNILTLEHLSIAKTNKNFNKNKDIPENMQLNSGFFPISDDISMQQMALPENMFLNIQKIKKDKAKRVLDQNMQTSFLYTNIVPMSVGLRDGLWAELRYFTRAELLRHKRLILVTGPVFLNNKNLGYLQKDKIPIPTHFFKIIVNPARHGSVSFVIPNQANLLCGNNARQCNLNDFIVPIPEIERITGITFFYSLHEIYKNRLKIDPNTMIIKQR